MVSEDLITEKVLAVGEVCWELDSVLTLGCDELVNGPLAARVSVFGDLDPDVTGTVG